MLEHDDISVDVKPVAPAHPFQSGLENFGMGIALEQAATMVTAESEEMALPAAVKALKFPGHSEKFVSSRRQCL